MHRASDNPTLSWPGRRIIWLHWVFHGSRYLLNHSLTSFVRLVSPTRSEGYVGSSDPEGNFPSSKTISLQNDLSISPTCFLTPSDNPTLKNIFLQPKTGSLKNITTHSPSLYSLGWIILLEICPRGNHISLYSWLIKCTLNIHGWQLVLINAYVKYLWNSILVWIF